MFDLETIVKMNDKAARVAPIEDNHSRACSFTGDSRGGVVLHSAKFRNTVFLNGSLRSSRQAANFIRRWNSVNSQEARNRIVEGYFQ
jgi:hypothetical protein